MLASPEPTAEAIWERFVDTTGLEAATTVYVEDKFDGIRAQLHRGENRVDIFSRDLRRMTDQFAEIAEQASKVFRRTNSRWRDHGLRAWEKTNLFRSAKTARSKESKR